MSSGATYLQGFLGHLASERRLSPLTCANYGRDVTELLKLAGEIPLDQLQVHQIRASSRNCTAAAWAAKRWRACFLPGGVSMPILPATTVLPASLCRHARPEIR